MRHPKDVFDPSTQPPSFEQGVGRTMDQIGARPHRQVNDHGTVRWIDHNEPIPEGAPILHLVEDGERLEKHAVHFAGNATHTKGTYWRQHTHGKADHVENGLPIKLTLSE